MKNLRITAVAAGTMFVAATLANGPALATPASGFTRAEVSTGALGTVDAKADKTDKWDLFLKTKDDSTLGLDRLSIDGGGHSGWHMHAGITIVTVISGEVVWYDGANPLCVSRTYRAGESFVEPANNVHLVHNPSGATVAFSAVQMRPAGTGGRLDAPKPTNCPTI